MTANELLSQRAGCFGVRSHALPEGRTPPWADATPATVQIISAMSATVSRTASFFLNTSSLLLP